MEHVNEHLCMLPTPDFDTKLYLDCTHNTFIFLFYGILKTVVDTYLS